MTTPTALPPAATVEHLTAVLRRAGVLGNASIRDVVVKSSRDTIVSHIIRLGIAYDDPPEEAPRSLILKLAHADYARTLWNAGRQEVAFYTAVAPLMPANLTPRCFDGRFDDETRAWHLLLEDLTESHQIATAWPLPSTSAQSRSIVAALARAHAAWWDDPRLGRSVGTWLETDAMNGILEQFAGHYARFAHLLGGPVEMEQSEAPPHLAPSVLQSHSENDKIAKLEEEIASLRMELSDLKQQFAELKRELGG